MLRFVALIGLFAAPAAADVAEISNCLIDHSFDPAFVYCDVTNKSDTAIATVFFKMEVYEEGRSVPWDKKGSDQTPRGADVAGGIEPDETRSVFLTTSNAGDKADGSKLTVAVTPIRFLDVNGDSISPSTP